MPTRPESARRAPRGARRAAVLLALAPFVVASPALAHAERSSSSPEPQERLRRPPDEVVIDFTEPPTSDAVVRVIDGCENDVVSDVDISGTEVTAVLAEGQPGRWRVQMNVVSGIDGHATRDSFEFRVRGGDVDCSGVAAPEEPERDGEEEGEGVSLVPLALGGAALVLLALIARLASRR